MDVNISLNRTQKIAFARIISDLIEADFIVEERELDFFEDIISKNGLKISEPMLVEAKMINLADAVSILKELDEKKRKIIIECLKDLALSDGTCVPLEAIQIFALEQAMEHDAYMYSVPSKEIDIDNMEVIYIENEKNTEVANTIEANYRSICNEFAMAGFDFVYIPFVVNDYNRMKLDYLKKVVRYMIPSVSQEKIDSISNDLQNITTARFCRDLLYKKINIPLLDVGPSLLIKINESTIIGQYDMEGSERINYANFLRIEMKGDMLPEIRKLIDSYHNMINCSITVNSMPKNQKFMYCGFHRSLFDLIAYGREQKEYKLIIDVTKRQALIYFEPVDSDDSDGERIAIKLTPHETALYVMIVKSSLDGQGLYWRERMNKRAEGVLKEYNKIYKWLSSGKKAKSYTDRTRVHGIRNKIRCHQCIANMDLFIPHHFTDGLSSYYKIKAPCQKIQIKE